MIMDDDFATLRAISNMVAHNDLLENIVASQNTEIAALRRNLKRKNAKIRRLEGDMRDLENDLESAVTEIDNMIEHNQLITQLN